MSKGVLLLFHALPTPPTIRAQVRITKELVRKKAEHHDGAIDDAMQFSFRLKFAGAFHG
jgi:hypothetical protein